MSNGSSSSGLSNLGIALTVVFIFSLFALLAQLFYVLRRRRFLLRQIPTTTTTTVHGGGEDNISKEQLLYFFCLRTSNLSRVEPSNIPYPSPASNESDPESETEVMVDMLKVQSMYGPSRVLCTIKEEDIEGVESADERSAEKEKKGDEVVMVVEDEAEEEDDGQFSTPCASPPFLTPSTSLTKDDFTSLPL